MVASRLANLNHGQKKADTEISVSQPEAAAMLNVSTLCKFQQGHILYAGHQFFKLIVIEVQLTFFIPTRVFNF